MNPHCRICDTLSKSIFETTVLKKYQIRYFQCPNCSFIQTEDPFWLEEAYESAITSLDIGLLNRNFFNLPITTALLYKYFNVKERFLDYGGGYGIFTRLMRDRGFDYFRQDIYCDNLFAKHFDITDISFTPQFEMLTAFEVFEHLLNPWVEIKIMLAFSDHIFFSTELVPEGLSNNSWWYFMPETGQHISLYSRKSLEFIANKIEVNFYTNGTNLHLFTKKKLNPFIFKLLTRRKIASLYNLVFAAKKSYLDSDYNLMLQKLQQ